QAKIDRLFRDDNARWQVAAINIAHSGRFSSDRTVGEYAAGIWNIRPSAEPTTSATQRKSLI
ncbi:MAG TPA: glycogen/starch/alpha-glucan phosphorylase, partial [Negativicutes bacterium]